MQNSTCSNYNFVLIMIGVFSLSAQAAPPDNGWIERISKELVDNDPVIRQKAEKEIASLGNNSDNGLEALCKSKDSTVALRAERLLFARKGIPSSIILPLQRKLYVCEQLNEEEWNSLLSELRMPPTQGKIESLIWMSSKVQEDEKKTKAVNSAIQSLITAKPELLVELDIQSIDTQNMATIISVPSKEQFPQRDAVYEKWRAKDSTIRNYISGERIELETPFLSGTNEVGAICIWLAEAKDPSLKRSISNYLRSRAKEGIEISPENMSRQETLGLLVHLALTQNDQITRKTYEAALDKFPNLKDKLPEELVSIEILRLRQNENISQAIVLACSGSQPNAPLQNWLIYEIGNHPWTNRLDLLPDGLPHVPEPRIWNQMGIILDDVRLRPSRGGRSPVCEEMLLFDKLAKHPEWLEAAWQSGKHELYFLTMIHRKKWPELLRRLDVEGSSEDWELLGELAAYWPDIRVGLPADKVEPAELRLVFSRFTTACMRSRLHTSIVLDTAEKWEDSRPHCFDKEPQPVSTMLHAARMWRDNSRNEAISTLMDLAFPNQKNGRWGNVNPTPFHQALIMLADLIGSDSSYDPQELLRDPRFTQMSLQTIHSRLSAVGDNTRARIMACAAVSKALRDRFGFVVSSGSFNTSHSRSMVIDLWKSGDEEMVKQVGDFLFNSLLYGAEDDTEYLAQWGRCETDITVLSLLGRAEDALDFLDKSKPMLKANEWENVRTCLLRELGRDQDIELISRKFPDPWFAVKMAIENEDWHSARRHLYPTEWRKEKDASQAVVLALSGEKTPSNKAWCAENPAASMVLGQPCLQEDLPWMANLAQYAAEMEEGISGSLIMQHSLDVSEFDNYLRYPDLFRNREQTSLLLADLANAKPANESKEDALSRNWICACTIACSGRTDLAFDLLRPSLLDGTGPDHLNDWNRAARYYQQPVVDGIDELISLAVAIWPEKSHQERINKLGEIFALKNPAARAAACFDLIEKHAQQPEPELLEWLLCDLSYVEKIDKSLSERISGWVAKTHFSDSEKTRIARVLNGDGWQDYCPFRPLGGPCGRMFELECDIGKNSDPKADNFTIAAGIAKAETLALSGQIQATKEQMRDALIRSILEINSNNETAWSETIQTSSRRLKSHFETKSLITFLTALEASSLPPDIAAEYAYNATNTPTWFRDHKRWLRAGRIFTKAKRYRNAVDCYRIFMVAEAQPNEQFREALIGMHTALGFLNLQDGHTKEAADNLKMLLVFAPFEPDQAHSLAQEIQEHPEALSAAKKHAETYWQARKREMPECHAFRYWAARWNDMLGK